MFFSVYVGGAWRPDADASAAGGPPRGEASYVCMYVCMYIYIYIYIYAYNTLVTYITYIHIIFI